MFMSDASQFLITHGGAVLFAFVFIEEAGLPLPAAPWLLAAGALWAGGKLDPVPAIGVVTLAALMADSIWFYIGRRGGARVLRWFCRLSLARSSCVGRSRNLVERHGLPALVAAKFIPSLGTVLPPLVGAMGMSTGRFLLFDGFGSLVYGASYMVVGFVFHNQLQQAMALLNRFGFGALLSALVLATGYVGFKYARRRAFSNSEMRPSGAANRNAGFASKDLAFMPADVLHANGARAAEDVGTLEQRNAALGIPRAASQSAEAGAVAPSLLQAL
jgi:membrane protein DedA with SNARE-associated domain